MIVRRLLEEGATCGPTTPRPGSGPPTLVPGLEVVADPYEVCDGARALAVLTEWDEFRWMDFDRVRRDVADSDRARHPQPPRPGRAAPAGLHVRRRRSLVDGPPPPSGHRRPPAPRGRQRGRPGSSARTSPSGSSTRGWDVVGLDNLLTGRMENLEGLLGREEFTFAHYDVTNFVHVDRRGRRGAALREPREPGRLPRAPDQDHEGRLARHAQHARARAGEGRPVLPRVDERGVRRPAGAPAAGGLLGPRQPGRAPRRLRRGEAVRRGARRSRTTAATASTCASCASSTRTVRGCGRPTGGSSRTSSCRRCGASRSRSTATASRPGRSATSTTRSAGILALLDSDHVGPVNIGNPNEFTILELAEAVHRRHRLDVGDRVRAAARPTTRRSASPTSRSRRSCSAGRRRSSSARVSTARTRGTAPSSAPTRPGVPRG